MYHDRMEVPKPLEIQRLIPRFLSASSDIEKYLQRRGPLSATHSKSISLAVSLIQFYLEFGQPKAIATTRKAAAVLGRLGGLRGGKARAKKLSARRRVAIAQLAAASRWEKAHR